MTNTTNNHHQHHNSNNHHHHDCDPCPPITPIDMCKWEEYLKPMVEQLIEDAKPDTSIIDSLLQGFSIYNSDEDILYNCGDVVLYEKDGKFYESLINENSRDPQDGNSWEEFGTLTSMFSKLKDLSNQSMLTFEYHASCMGNSCTAIYPHGACVAMKVDTGTVDECDNPIYEDFYYISLEDRNIDNPEVGALKDPPTWDGPHSACDLIKGSAITCDNLCAVNKDCISDDLILGV